MATAASRPSSCLSSLHITSPDPLNSSTAATRPRPPLSPAEPRAEEGWNGEGGRDSTKHHTAGSTGDLALGRARLWIPAPSKGRVDGRQCAPRIFAKGPVKILLSYGLWTGGSGVWIPGLLVPSLRTLMMPA